MKKNCLICKKDFYKQPTVSIKKWSITKFCSHLCYWKDKLNKPSWNKGGKLSEEHKRKLSASHIGKDNHQKGRHHTRETKEKLRIAKSGSKSNLWKGGVSKLTPLIRGSFKYRLWRDDVFTRDSYTCQECGIKSGCGYTVYFEAHHIESLSTIREKYNIKTLEEALCCQELWNTNNGITLCLDCHKLTDTYAGKNRFKSLNTNI